MAGIAALAAAYIFSQFYRSFLAVLTPILDTELGAGKTELSLASGVWFLTFALMQFVVGISLDRYGPKKTAAFLFAAGPVVALSSSPLPHLRSRSSLPWV